MWIKRKEYEQRITRLEKEVTELTERLRSLESEVKEETIVTQYRMPYGCLAPSVKLTISLQTLVMQILDHLRLDLEFIKGTPDEVKLVKFKDEGEK